MIPRKIIVAFHAFTGRALVLCGALSWTIAGLGVEVLASAPPEPAAKIPFAATATSAADAACFDCHQEKAVSYAQTAHHRTSLPASGDSIHGSFAAGANRLRTRNPNLYFQMDANDRGFFQTAIARTSPTEVLTRSERIEVVVGSGRKGQTYLFWDDDRLFQLPVSYWTEGNVWVNSPGYLDGRADFERPIARRCLECHATAFESRAPPENAYVKNSLVLGLSCEKCHGPGEKHIALYRSNTPPASPADAAIVNPARLSRERQMDLCALCHAGIGEPLTTPGSFVPGDELAKHLVFPHEPLGTHIDVHGSQVQLLERSRCFQASPSLTCTTCHDVHQTQRDSGAMSQSCVNCHQIERCGEFRRRGRAIAGQCVTCHMPLEQTDRITIAKATGGRMDPSVRNHRIAIYPDRSP